MNPYRWSDGQGFTVLPTGSFGYALAVNGRSTAVGARWDPVVQAYHAAAWPRAGGMIALSPNDPNPHIAVAINDPGAVAGWSSLDCCGGENHATLWTFGQVRVALR